MTLSIGSASEGNDKSNGSALEPTQGEASVAAFLGAAGERTEIPGKADRPLYAKMLDYSAHAAMIVGLLGFAWTVSDHVAKRPADATAKVAAAMPAPKDENAELRATTQKMAADISALRLTIDSLRGSIRQDKTSEQIKSLIANLDSVKAGLASTKTETSTSLNQLTGKVDHLQHNELATKIQQISEKLDKLEHQNADMTPTASIAATKIVTPPLRTPAAKPEAAVDTAKKPTAVKTSLTPEPAATAEAAKKPTVIAEWVVREVYDGVAVVESKHGPMEVVPGVTIPGAGVVKSIDRHGTGWTVTTSKGQIAYMPMPRDRSPRDFYRSAPEDF